MSVAIAKGRPVASRAVPRMYASATTPWKFPIVLGSALRPSKWSVRGPGERISSPSRTGIGSLASAVCARAGHARSPTAAATNAHRPTLDCGIGCHKTPRAGDVATGRRLFVDFGCASCHAVKGEAFGAKAGEQGVGPDLTGMGSHHPAEYFVESILNPDAVLVDGPGYSGPDGRSVMPAYPEMTLLELADLVAYLQSLTAGGMQHAMASVQQAPAELPAPPPQDASRFLVQVYDVNQGDLRNFETRSEERRVGKECRARWSP